MTALAAIPAEDEALRPRVRAFLEERLAGMPLDRRARTWMGFDADFTRELGARGFLGLTIPREFGGQGRSAFARFVVVEELLSAGAPVAAHWIGERQTAPLLARYGTDRQKAEIVPAICRGELSVCIGMSEPNSGSDLASVRSKAKRTADGWRLNGSKIWTTFAHKADYMVALVRTSGAADDRQAGLSQVLIDMRAQGVTVSPIRDLAGDEHFAEVRFDDVDLPEDALIGVEGQGWAQVNAELGFERSGPERIYSSMGLIDGWAAFLRRQPRVGDDEQRLIGRLFGRFATLRALSLQVAARLDTGENPVMEASVVKDLGTQFEQDAIAAVADAMAARDPDELPAELLAALRYLELMGPTFSLRGGTREILRGIIARGLGLR